MFPCLGCCELCCSGHGGTDVYPRWWLYFLWTHTRRRILLDFIGVLLLLFWGTDILFSVIAVPQWLLINSFIFVTQTPTWIRLLPSLWKVSSCPSSHLSPLQPTRGNSCPDFFSHHRLVFLISKHPTNGICMLLFLLGKWVELIDHMW